MSIIWHSVDNQKSSQKSSNSHLEERANGPDAQKTSNGTLREVSTPKFVPPCSYYGFFMIFVGHMGEDLGKKLSATSRVLFQGYLHFPFGFTLHETNSSPLKNNSWKTIFLLGFGLL